MIDKILDTPDPGPMTAADLGLVQLIRVTAATIKAYADCNYTGASVADYEPTFPGMTDRNLQFKADILVSKQCAIEIMKVALGEDGSYNNFTPNLLKEFPDDALFRLGRDNSVCIWVLAGKEPLPSGKEVQADEVGPDSLFSDDGEAIMFRYWWD